jgi:hypothetical protein
MIARAKVCIERIRELLIVTTYLIERAVMANPIF